MSRTAACALALALALAVAPWAEAASPLPNVASVCSGQVGSPPPVLARPLDEVLENDPEQALAAACHRIARAGPDFDTLLQLGQSVVALGRQVAAVQILDGLDESAARERLGVARLALVRAALARDAGQQAQARAQADRAWAELQTHAEVPVPLRVEALLTRAAALRALEPTRSLARAAADVDEAERLLLAAGRQLSYQMGWVYNERTMQAYARDDYAGTLHWARRELALVRRISGHDAPAQLHALATLLAVTSAQRRHDTALRYGREGQRIGRLAPAASRAGYLGILNSMAPALVRLGRPLQSLEVANEAVALASATWGPDSVQMLTPLERRAAADEVLQRHAQARRSYERMLAILQRQGEGIALIRRLRITDIIAGYLLRVGDVDGAQRLVDQGHALIAEGAGLAFWRGRMLRQAAFIAAAQQRWAQADDLAAQAGLLMQGALGASNPYLTGLIGFRCNVQSRARAEAPACDEAAARLPTLREDGPGQQVTLLLALAQHAAQRGAAEQVRDHLLQAVSAAQTDDNPQALWSVLDQMAVQLRRDGQPALAVLLAKQAVERIEAVRRSVSQPTDLPPSLRSDRLALARRLADWLLQDGRVDEALAVMRLLKGDEFRSFVEGRVDEPLAAQAGLLPATPPEQRWLRASPLTASAAPATPSQPSVQQTRERQARLAQAWRLALRLPVGPSATSLPVPSPRQGPQDLWATVFLGEGHVNHVLQGSTGRRVVRVPVDVPELRRDIGRLLSRMARREDTLALQQSLFQRLAAPLADEAARVGATRLLLQLDGDLRYVPYAALHDGRSLLVQRLAVEQRVAGGDRPERPRAGTTAPWIDAFGSTRAAAGLPALPGVAAELCAIVDGRIDAGAERADCPWPDVRGAVEGRGWLDDAFSAQALRLAAATAMPLRRHLLHIGTHFVLNPGEVGRSWMLLGDGTRLPLSEMLRWRFADQHLVTLSACQTGVGGGGEVEGLASLILARGAQAVLATLWPVDDRGSGELMGLFYRRLQAGEAPAEALRAAQLQLLGGARGTAALHPFHWAGFVLSTREP